MIQILLTDKLFIGAKISNFQCECKSGFNGRLCENGKGDEGKRYRKRLVTGFCFVYQTKKNYNMNVSDDSC